MHQMHASTIKWFITNYYIVVVIMPMNVITKLSKGNDRLLTDFLRWQCSPVQSVMYESVCFSILALVNH